VKILFDTNVWLAAFITHGTCAELLEYCLEAHTLLVSEAILREIEEKLSEKFDVPKSKVQETLTFVRSNTTLVSAIPLPSPVCRDSDDDQILAAAKSGQVDCLVTGDPDLLVLERFQGIPIIKPGQFWSFEKKKFL
jgi:putative PIN family toxin of toxin-antitoxin system